MREYRSPNGERRLWFEDNEIDAYRPLPKTPLDRIGRYRRPLHIAKVSQDPVGDPGRTGLGRPAAFDGVQQLAGGDKNAQL